MTWFNDAARTAAVALAPPGSPGLRRAQVGAAWAIAAAFTSGRPAAALAVLPTGTGKSAVLGLVPLLVPPDGPVLVTAPARLVRDQLVETFREQRLLIQAGVLPPDTSTPVVRVVEHRLKTTDDWVAAAAGADVVIGTIGVLSPHFESVAAPPKRLFGLVLVDEAHHSPAATWAALLESLPSANKALVTATPVRSDRAEVRAELVFSYSVGDALRDGVIAHVTFVPVSVGPGDDRDAALARAAAERLAAPEHVAGRSLLLVRAGSVADAQDLKAVYEAAGVAVGVVTAATRPTTFRKLMSALDDGALQGLVTVGVLGEGFDLPRAKIAVYHRKHQSLGATLQFAGRVSRTGPRLGPAELLAIPGEDVARETRELYEADTDWSRVLSGLADAGLEDERERRAFLAGLRDQRNTPLAPEPLSAAAIRVARDTLVFRIDPELHRSRLLDATVLRVANGDVVLDRASEDGRMRILVTARREKPDWLASDALDTEGHALHVAVLDPISPVLFVHSPSDVSARSVVSALGFTGAAAEDTGWVSRFLAGLDVTSYFSVGMRATRLPGGTLATYTSLAGTSVGPAVSAAHSIAYTAGHLILLARNPFGDGSPSTSVGVSVRRAKVWSPGRSDLVGFRRWCERVGELGRSDRPTGANAPSLGLRIPQTLRAFPARPLAAMPDSRLLLNQPVVLVGGRGFPLAAVELVPVRLSETRMSVKGHCDRTVVLDAEVDLTGTLKATSEDPRTRCRLPGATETISLVEALEAPAPLQYYYADSSSSLGTVLNTAPGAPPPFPAERLSRRDWARVDTRAESKAPRPGLMNVQTAMTQWHAASAPPGHATVVLNDDGSGEVADLVVITLPPALAALAEPFRAITAAERAEALASTDQVAVTLSHCKYASSDSPRRDLSDIDELVGQAHRSARWLINHAAFWQVLADRAGRRASVVHGDPGLTTALLADFAASPPRTYVTVQVVQPGLDVSKVPGWTAGETLLGFCLDALGTVGADLHVLGS